MSDLATASPNLTIVSLSIEKIVPSPDNPRRTFHDDSIAELAESIKKRGLINPISVRAVNGHYEIMAGERRWRACRMAGLTEIPSIVADKISDDDASLVSIEENIQREDLNPIDEARGYKVLMDKLELDVPSLAIRVHKTETHVRRRVALLDLAQEVQDALLTDRVSLSHAALISRLPDHDRQREALQKTLTERLTAPELSAHVLDLSLSLSKAPFLSECLNCEKRTGIQRALFAEAPADDRCLDAGCFKDKYKAYILKMISAHEAKGGQIIPKEVWEKESLNAKSNVLKAFKAGQYPPNYGKIHDSATHSGCNGCPEFGLYGEETGNIPPIRVHGACLKPKCWAKQDEAGIAAAPSPLDPEKQDKAKSPATKVKPAAKTTGNNEKAGTTDDKAIDRELLDWLRRETIAKTTQGLAWKIVLFKLVSNFGQSDTSNRFGALKGKGAWGKANLPTILALDETQTLDYFHKFAEMFVEDLEVKHAALFADAAGVNPNQDYKFTKDFLESLNKMTILSLIAEYGDDAAKQTAKPAMKKDELVNLALTATGITPTHLPGALAHKLKTARK